MDRIPIACTLTASGAQDRLSEWSSFVANHVSKVVRTPQSAQLLLRDPEGSVQAAVDLARREKACCAFFEFRLRIEADSASLEIEAPEGAEFVLDSLVERR